MTRPRWARLTRAPLALQVMALLAVSVIVAQAATAVLVLVIPPPRPAICRIGEVAAALRGGGLATRYGGRLQRSAAAEAPAPPAHPRRSDAWDRLALASALQADPDAVRLISAGPPHIGPFQLGGPRHWRDHGPDGPFGHGPSFDRSAFGPPPFGHPPVGGAQSPGSPPAGAPAAGSPEGADRILIGRFTAAWRRAPGSWVVVASPPPQFPTGWQQRMMLWIAASLAVVLPAGYVFARRITAPLADFAAAAKRFGADPSAAAMALAGPAEVGVAADAFNDMQAQLRRYVADRTAMVAAISHDLRTPLARIRFKMEAASPELRAAVIADVAQMDEMIGAALEFIRDAGARRPRERLDLISLLECVADDAALLGADVTLEGEGYPIVRGDAGALRRLFANLVDNAVTYGGCGRISLTTAGETVAVDIADSGPGLPDEELERVFEPFYRADAARNLDSGGVGLGLAVARSVAREHGGDVRLSSSPTGLTARVELPLAEPAKAR